MSVESAAVTDLIQQRIRKYTRDLASHPAPSQPDGLCRCDRCRDARVILNELRYMEMADRYQREVRRVNRTTDAEINAALSIQKQPGEK